RPHAKNQPDRHTHGNSQRGGPDGDDSVPFQGRANHQHQGIYQNQRQYAAGSGQRHRFQQELPGNVLAFRANRFADANFSRAFGHAHKHDVHHADSADEQSDRAQHHRAQVHHGHDVVELIDLLCRRGDRKIVFAVVGHVTTTTQDLRRFVHHQIQLSGIRLDAHVQLIRGWINLFERVERNQHAAVLVAHAEPALRLFHHANHLEVGAVDHYILANRVPFRKQHRRDVLAEHHYFFFVYVIAFRDESAFDRRRVRIHLAEIRLHAAKIDRRHFAGFGSYRVRLHPGSLDEGGYILDGLAAFLDGF